MNVAGIAFDWSIYDAEFGRLGGKP